MTPARPLLDPAQPHPDECLQSIIIRLAKVAAVTPDRLLLTGLGARTLDLTEHQLERLALIGSYDLTDLRARWSPSTEIGRKFLNCNFPSAWVVCERTRLAPKRDSNEESFWLSCISQVLAIPCDLATGQILIDRCPNCGLPLSFNRPQFLRCWRCEFDLHQVRPTYSDAKTVELARELGGFILDGSPLAVPSPFCELNDIELFRCMEWFAKFSDLPVGIGLRVAPQNALAGLAAMKRWPESFDETLDWFQRKLIAAPEKERVVRARICAEFQEIIVQVRNDRLERIFMDRAAERTGFGRDRVEAESLFCRPAIDVRSQVGRSPIRTAHYKLPPRIILTRSSHSKSFRRTPPSN